MRHGLSKVTKYAHWYANKGTYKINVDLMKGSTEWGSDNIYVKH